MKVTLGLANSLAQLVFLWPTIFTSLSNPPAALFFLNGLWLVILAITSSSATYKSLLLVAGSSLLGISAWIRVFYFYPLMVFIVFYMIGFLSIKNRKINSALLFSALIPIAFQFSETLQNTGKFSYFNSSETESVTNWQLSGYASGSDTIYPGIGHYF